MGLAGGANTEQGWPEISGRTNDDRDVQIASDLDPGPKMGLRTLVLHPPSSSIALPGAREPQEASGRHLPSLPPSFHPLKRDVSYS